MRRYVNHFLLIVSTLASALYVVRRIKVRGGRVMLSLIAYHNRMERTGEEIFGGRSDGKFGVRSEKVSLFQALISAGDN